jgi:hypothetical protein
MAKEPCGEMQLNKPSGISLRRFDKRLELCEDPHAISRVLMYFKILQYPTEHLTSHNTSRHSLEEDELQYQETGKIRYLAIDNANWQLIQPVESQTRFELLI